MKNVMCYGGFQRFRALAAGHSLKRARVYASMRDTPVAIGGQVQEHRVAADNKADLRKST